MKLSPSDLFTLFNQAAAAVGSPGYGGKPLNQQTVTTIQAWTEFHAKVSQYWPKDAVSYSVGNFDNYISSLCSQLDDKERQRLYEHLYALGCRKGR